MHNCAQYTQTKPLFLPKNFFIEEVDEAVEEPLVLVAAVAGSDGFTCSNWCWPTIISCPSNIFFSDIIWCLLFILLLPTEPSVLLPLITLDWNFDNGMGSWPATPLASPCCLLPYSMPLLEWCVISSDYLCYHISSYHLYNSNNINNNLYWHHIVTRSA